MRTPLISWGRGSLFPTQLEKRRQRRQDQHSHKHRGRFVAPHGHVAEEVAAQGREVCPNESTGHIVDRNTPRGLGSYGGDEGREGTNVD